MENMNLYLIVSLTVVVLFAFFLVGYIIYRTEKESEDLDTPKSSQPKIPTAVSNMSYTNIMEIVDKMIHFEVSNVILKNGLRNKSEEELSVVLDDHILTISETVYRSMSMELLTVLQYYITDNYIKNYIKDTSRLILVANLMSVGASTN